METVAHRKSSIICLFEYGWGTLKQIGVLSTLVRGKWASTQNTSGVESSWSWTWLISRTLSLITIWIHIARLVANRCMQPNLEETLSLIWDLHSKTWLTYQWHDLFWDSIWDNRRWGIPAGPQTWCSGNKQLLWVESNTVSLVSLRSRWPTPEQWRWHSPWQKWRSRSWVLHWHGSEQNEIARLWSYNSCYVQTLIFSATIILSAFLRWYVVMEMT